MNYRHAFHAGNFADVVKHTVLVRIIDYLKRKEKAFRIIDTHAGTGLYDLSSEEAQRTGEWRDGIARLVTTKIEGEAASLFRPLLDSVLAVNQGYEVTRYPGSPLLVRHLLRRQDRLTAIELHPQDVAALKMLFAGDHQVRVIELDGWLALGAHVPPKEKRGVVLVDPPFEKAGEFERLVDGLKRAYRRWPGGIYALWYPIKDRAAVVAFRQALKESCVPDILDISLEIRPPSPEPRLDGSGMIVVNPPYVLGRELEILLPVLARTLGDRGASRFSLTQLTGEAPVSP
ncbi:23S rRNA (adenine(2030)-N(6))-methyltransferase RlmJ [Chelativorans sp. M5D2P16]|uniref:23S rRNA (adenine(2030)-N(6))-methyltransferase RlmJ n=1 Tax=Chelativorans sp. M5D2P16 TaxID=3095678 RepID=UPI002ACA62F7|nr:23S rRNA (adenine(2030)-N(6))-methyltransferase RlmJ [Chelativorans sp. M5D2P16]MDZ5696316.1 23S rRNA (adenine(2030)-N(6))-methyltransferase RlmJ [Chelativorans sp. M5D2P16]